MTGPDAMADQGPAEPTVSVVICAYTFDRFEDVLACVGSTLPQVNEASDVIVVVDHNAALAEALAEKLPAGVRILANAEEQGLSGARNTGVRFTAGEVVVFLDDDAVLASDGVARFVRTFRDPDVLGVCARIVPAYDGPPPDWLPPEFLWVVGCTYEGQKPGPVRNVLGAAMAIRRSVFEATGGFRTGLGRGRDALPMGCEETELCIRASHAFPGGRFLYDDAALAFHRVTRERCTWRYFRRRCYAEGLSKAYLSHHAGQADALSTEQSYVSRVLPAGCWRDLKAAVARRSPRPLMRIAATGLGLGAAAVAYGYARLKIAVRGMPGGEVHPSEREADRDLFANAGLLSVAAAASSVLGFLYWWLAAQLFLPAPIGYAAAALSLIAFLGNVGEVGLGAMLIGDLARAGRSGARLMATAILVAGLASGLLGAAVVAASLGLSLSFGTILGSAEGAALFIAACGLTGALLVMDQGLVGLLQARLHLLRNVVFNAAKLGLLALFAVSLKEQGEIAITLSWVVAQVLSIAVLFAAAPSVRGHLLSSPQTSAIAGRLPSVLGHHALTLASLAPGLLLPFMVAVVLSPETNAAFYACWMLVSMAYLVPASLAVSFYAVVSRQEAASWGRRMSSSLLASLGFGVLACAAIAVLARPLLGIFSPAYPDIASASLVVLGSSIVLISVKYHYVALQRARGRMTSALGAVTLGSLAELGAAAAGGLAGRLEYLAVGYVVALLLETAFMAPVLWKALEETRAEAPAPQPILANALSKTEGPP